MNKMAVVVLLVGGRRCTMEESLGIALMEIGSWIKRKPRRYEVLKRYSEVYYVETSRTKLKVAWMESKMEAR